MSTTTNRPTPATATKLHSMLDDLLSPTRASAPELPTTPPTATSLVDDLNAVVRRSQPRPPRVPAPQPEPVALHEAYEWDPEPTVDDPWGMRERMDTLETAIAARTAPRQAVPVVDPQAETRAARLSEAHRRIDEILG
jgi:hypothetical protein